MTLWDSFFSPWYQERHLWKKLEFRFWITSSSPLSNLFCSIFSFVVINRRRQTNLFLFFLKKRRKKEAFESTRFFLFVHLCTNVLIFSNVYVGLPFSQTWTFTTQKWLFPPKATGNVSSFGEVKTLTSLTKPIFSPSSGFTTVRLFRAQLRFFFSPVRAIQPTNVAPPQLYAFAITFLVLSSKLLINKQPAGLGKQDGLLLCSWKVSFLSQPTRKAL